MEDTQVEPVIGISCTTEYAAYQASKSETCWGLVSLKASCYEPEEAKRPALDIVAVIDKSGSMQGEKLFLVKRSLEFLIQNLLEKDRLCVITYDTQVYVDFHLLQMKQENKEFAKQKIREIADGSCTNLCGGLLKGLCEILDRKEKNEVASVLLFTDGLANEGITNESQIIKAMGNPRRHDMSPLMQQQQQQRYQTMLTQVMPRGNVAQAQPFMQNLAVQNAVNEPLEEEMQQGPEAQQPEEQEEEEEQQQQQQFVVVQQSQEPQQQQQQIPAEEMLEEQAQSQQAPVQTQQAHQAPAQQSGSSWGLNKMFNFFRGGSAKPAAVPLPHSTHVVASQPVHEEEVKVDIDASVYTFGFGKDHDPDLLKAISDAANGMYFFIENEEQISPSFGHCFGGLVSTLGQNIKLKLELCEGVTLETIHTDHKLSKESASLWQVELGDMQSEEERDVLLLINLPDAPSSTEPSPIMKSSITYFSVVDYQYKSSEAEMVVIRSDNVQHTPKDANRSVDRQRNRILTTKAVKEALHLADTGKFDAARNRFKGEIQRVKSSLTGEDDFCKLLIKDLERSLAGLKDKHSYVSSGKKSQLNMLQMHSKQRSNRTDDNAYVSVSNVVYQKKFKS